MKMLRYGALVMAWLASTRLALAHAGHGGETGGAYLLHYLVQPIHLIPVALVAVGVIMTVRQRRLQAVRSRR